MNRLGMPVVFVALCLVSALALASNVLAAERTIEPNSSFSIDVELSFMEFCSYEWTSDVPLDFTVYDPEGLSFPYEIDATIADGEIIGYRTGTYTLTWSNDASTTAHLSFDVSDSYKESGVEEAMSAFMWAMIIVGIIIVAVVVIIVIVVVMGGKTKHAQPPMGPPPQMATQAMVTGHCPTCGTQLDPNASFCSKCGTRYR